MKTNIRAALAGLVTSTAMLSTAWAEDIKVGLLLPYSGVYASLGQDIDDAFALGLETFGADSGATFEIVREDDEVKPPVGLAKTKKLILQDEVDVMVGVVSSGVLGAIRDTVDGAGVPLIVANAGNDEATGEACSPYITRISFSNSQVNRPMGPVDGRPRCEKSLHHRAGLCRRPPDDRRLHRRLHRCGRRGGWPGMARLPEDAGLRPVPCQCQGERRGCGLCLFRWGRGDFLRQAV
jgi:hypothetical protein